MFAYSGLFKSVEMPFAETSKFYVEQQNAYVCFKVRTSANFSEQYQAELIQQINVMFDFKQFNTNSNVVFLISEVLDRLVDDNNRNLFMYLIFKCMYTKRFCGTLDQKIELNEKNLRYRKANFVKLLKSFPIGIVNTYAQFIYSAIIDSAENFINYTTDEQKAQKLAYKVALVAKEYLDDLEAFLQGKENVGYPRFNKNILKTDPLKGAWDVINKAKQTN